MTMPKQSDIEQPILTVLRAFGGQAAPKDVYARLEQFFEDLTEADKAEQLTSGALRWRNRVQFARQNLVMQGLIDPSERGLWRLTAAGAQRAPSPEPEAAELMPAAVPAEPQDGSPTLIPGADTDPIYSQRNAHEELQRQQLLT
jgi:restriction endonuclease Mrr